ncbi:MAG TPA: helix-turn-helix transcriptional regulator [Burkholderiaceae bacterium]|nr:helix-turn-helix transcriptional regulator [Burkholderiaceae bacterium]
MRLRLLRISKRMEIQELARRSGVSKSTLSRIENRKACVKLDNFIAICQALEANPINLICGGDTWNPAEVQL